MGDGEYVWEKRKGVACRPPATLMPSVKTYLGHGMWSWLRLKRASCALGVICSSRIRDCRLGPQGAEASSDRTMAYRPSTCRDLKTSCSTDRHWPDGRSPPAQRWQHESVFVHAIPTRKLSAVVSPTPRKTLPLSVSVPPSPHSLVLPPPNHLPLSCR